MASDPPVWDDDRAQQLASALACLARLSDYDVLHEWRDEIAGHNNELELGAGTIPGVSEHTPEWRKMARIRTWWLFLRQDAGVTLAEAAEAIDVHPSSVSRWEAGEREPSGDEGDRYQAWLVGQREHLIEAYRARILGLASIRDAWPAQPTGPELEATQREFWRLGGWFDTWRRTGVLPNTNRGTTAA